MTQLGLDYSSAMKDAEDRFDRMEMESRLFDPAASALDTAVPVVQRDGHENAVAGAVAVKITAKNSRGQLLRFLNTGGAGGENVLDDEWGRSLGGRHWDRRMRELRQMGWTVETVPLGWGIVGWRLTRELDSEERRQCYE